MSGHVATDLEQFLQQQMGEGHLDSTGRFSIEAQRALEKTAAFQLPSPAAWILKIVQAAVAAGCSAIQIHQRESETEVVFRTAEAWDLKYFEGCFFSINSEDDRSLDHLKRGLWSCGYHGRRPFRMTVQGCPQSLVWTGKEFAEQILPRLQQTSIVVSHRPYDAKTSRFQGGANVNKLIENELRTGAYVCPVPLLLGETRLDSLQGCPTHGLGDYHYPLRASWVSMDGLSMPIPPATLGGYKTRSCEYANLARLFGISPNCDANPAAAILISMHLKETVKSSVVRGETREYCELEWFAVPSLVYWVLDGVIVGTSQIAQSGAISAALFCSAQGVKTDATGLRIVQDDLIKQRRRDACQRFSELVNGFSVDLKVVSEAGKSLPIARMVGGACILGSMLLCPVNLIWGLGGLAVGTALAFRGSSAELGALNNELPQNLQVFRLAWKTMLAQDQIKSAL